MKKTMIIGSVLFIALFSGCLEDSPSSPCICTEEFRTIFNVVIGPDGNPVDSMAVTVKDPATGTAYQLQSGYPPYAHWNLVMSDQYTPLFSTTPRKIVFIAEKDTLRVEQEYSIITDNCKCHVYKAAGPDTIYIK